VVCVLGVEEKFIFFILRLRNAICILIGLAQNLLIVYCMKKLLIFSALAVTAALVYAQTAPSPSNLAKVESQDGLMIFIRSVPAGEYEVLGSVNMPALVWSGNAGPMIDMAVSRCLKQYPQANGVALSGSILGNVRAIKVK
jgi:hypothetical protein